ncbi:MAG: aminotransferase class V-fold PLP-dependent enzyme [Acetobacteraceae bacterium]|nr:aminotransferase class V-fold PLP-dependent enzyme [Acetobacteraceae bacterium]
MSYYQSRALSGRHFLQIPGPSNVPDRVLRAIGNATMDHRGPDFGKMGTEILQNLPKIFQTMGPVLIFPSSGTGAWEAALTNTLSPGDTVLMARTGQFAVLWEDMARRLGLQPIMLDTDWRHGADPQLIAAELEKDKTHRIQAVCVVHCETSTGCITRIEEVRAAMDAAKHPALLIVDAISSLAAMEVRHDAWGVDVTIAGSQKAMMMPPGLSFNAVSERALAAAQTAKLPHAYFDWDAMLEINSTGYFPYTPAISLLYGLNEAIKMMLEEGLENVYARHDRFGEASRRAAAAWGLDNNCLDAREFSSSVTTLRTPEGHSANNLRAVILEKFNMSLGTGLGVLSDKAFRIGHLGYLNDLTLVGTLGGVEMGMAVAGVPHKPGGVQAALEFLAGNARAVA